MINKIKKSFNQNPPEFSVRHEVCGYSKYKVIIDMDAKAIIIVLGEIFLWNTSYVIIFHWPMSHIHCNLDKPRNKCKGIVHLKMKILSLISCRSKPVRPLFIFGTHINLFLVYSERSLTRAVVLESGLETFFYRLGLVLDLLVFGLGLGHRTRQMFKLVSTESSNICFFFSFKTKTRLFRKWVM